MKRILNVRAASLVALMLLLAVPGIVDAATFTASETVANLAAVNDQTDTTVTSPANVVEVKATRTLTVGALPTTTESIIIGSCTVTFTAVAGATTDDADCSGGATIDTNTGAGDVNRTPTEVATALKALTNVTDTGHGALSVTASSTSATSAVFTTTGTEASATPITFTDSTAGDITSTNSVTGVVPVAQVNTISIAGTVEAGDIFTATIPTVGAVSYTVLSTDTTTTLIAAGLGKAIVDSSGYASQAFTVATSTNTIVLTAKVAGTGFTQTSGTTNRTAVAQTVTFTPADVDGNKAYSVTINDTTYTNGRGPDNAKEVVDLLTEFMADDTAVNCSDNDIVLTCTAITAGTAFTYDASISSSNRSSSGGSSSRRSSRPSTDSTPVTQTVEMSPASTASKNTFLRDLFLGVVGEDVRALQVYLNSKGFTLAETGAGSAGGETTMFGALTRAALVKFQAAMGIAPAAGYFGPKTRAYISTSP